MDQNTDDEALAQRAYDAFDNGKLDEASHRFAELLARQPDKASYHYMRGLAHKYLCDWPVSLQHNLRVQELEEHFNEAAAWNAGIAATALGDWAQARRQWAACGIRVPEGDGPIEGDFGLVSIRLNPWDAGETVFARRIDPVRARLLNVPLPESGHRLFDIVLHDGARTGERRIEGGVVPVFNALSRLAPSDLRTFVVFARCDAPDDIEALQEASLPGIGYVEDWTHSIAHYCLRCSHGSPHRHDDEAQDGDWNQDRNLGIGAQSRVAVEKLLADWVARGTGRRVDAIEEREHPAPARVQGHVWWRGPDEEGEEDADQAQSL